MPRTLIMMFVLIIICFITLHQLPRSLQVRLVSCFFRWFPVFEPFILLFFPLFSGF